MAVVGAFGVRAADLGGVGLTTLEPDTSYLAGMLAEAMGTFLLVFTIMALAVDRRAPVGWAGLVIGLAVTTEILVIGPITGGSVNPARTFGPYIATSLFGGSTPWSEFPLYVLGPLIGGTAAALVYDLVARPVRDVPEETDRVAGTTGPHKDITGNDRGE